jgi:hypothetical protein
MNGIRSGATSMRPKNHRQQVTRLNRKRDSPPGSVAGYKRYIRDAEAPANEQSVFLGIAQLLKHYDDGGYGQMSKIPFTAFPRNVGFNNGLSPPQPDFIQGAQLRSFAPFPAAEELTSAVLLQGRDPGSITLPHMTGELKAPSLDLTDGEPQNAYSGASLVYAREEALEYLGNQDPPGHGVIQSFIANGAQLGFYSHHATTNEDGKKKYHQSPIALTSLTMSLKDWRKGRRQLRNMQDNARAESCALRDRLIAYWRERQDVEQSASKQATVITNNDHETTPKESLPQSNHRTKKRHVSQGDEESEDLPPPKRSRGRPRKDSKGSRHALCGVMLYSTKRQMLPPNSHRAPP